MEQLRRRKIGRNIESFLIKVDLGEMLGDAGALSLGKPAVSFGQAFRFLIFFTFFTNNKYISWQTGGLIWTRIQDCISLLQATILSPFHQKSVNCGPPPLYSEGKKGYFFDNFEGEILELKKKRLR